MAQDFGKLGALARAPRRQSAQHALLAAPRRLEAARPMAALSTLLVVAMASVARAGIYPDGHFAEGRSTELTTNTTDDFVKEHVDAGKTVFIRWIASEG